VALVVLDAGILIGYLTSHDAHHESASAALRGHAGDELRLPASAYAEVLVGPIREGRVARARAEITALLLSIDPIDASTAEAAADLRARFPAVRLPDALVIAHGEMIEADAVLTTDRSWRRLSRRVEVIG
jgi:predicted nucleic acid-binding protein